MQININFLFLFQFNYFLFQRLNYRSISKSTAFFSGGYREWTVLINLLEGKTEQKCP